MMETSSLFRRGFAKTQRLLCGPKSKRYRYLFEVIKENRCRRIMEIGTWNGRHALQMIKVAQRYHPAEQVEYYGFDLFELMTNEITEKELAPKKAPAMAEVDQMLEGTGARIRLYCGFTRDTLPPVVPHLSKMDLIFIDGGHSIDTIANDWEYSRQLMNDNTVVIFDDFYFDRDDVGCKKIVEGIDGAKYDVVILPRRDQFKKPWGVLSINLVRASHSIKSRLG